MGKVNGMIGTAYSVININYTYTPRMTTACLICREWNTPEEDAAWKYLSLPPTQVFPATLKVESVEHGQPICIMEDDELNDDDDDEEFLMAQNVLAMLTMVLEDEENGVEIEEI